MRRFWDDRARENAYFFVDDRVDYRRPDVERFWERGEADLQTLLDTLGLQIGSTDTVVEIGCGVGRLTRGIALRAARVIAIDVSEEMLSRAQENLEGRDNVELIHGDGTSLTPIGDSIADACVSHVVFQHLPRSSMVMGYVGEMGRVLRPGGWSGFQLSNDPSIHRPTRPPVGDRLRSRLHRGPRGRGDPAWLGTAVELDELESVARRSQMSVQRVRGRGTQFCLVALRRDVEATPMAPQAPRD